MHGSSSKYLLHTVYFQVSNHDLGYRNVKEEDSNDVEDIAQVHNRYV